MDQQEAREDKEKRLKKAKSAVNKKVAGLANWIFTNAYIHRIWKWMN